MICGPEKCTGCGACSAACPALCIHFEADEQGVPCPVVEEEACTHCDRCKAVCPSLHPPVAVKPQTAYACWSIDETRRAAGASGGLAAVLAEEVLGQGGLVYGAAWQQGRLCHICVEQPEQLFLLQGSKYLQSDCTGALGDAVRQVKQGRKVLFIGTPCQVAGLKKLVKGGAPNLLTVDLICHGVPPAGHWQEYLRSIGCEQADAATFRKNGDYYVTLYRRGEEMRSMPPDGCLYMLAFFAGLSFRPGCYACPYARLERVSDITIGDFWGLGNDFPHSTAGGVSLALPLTPAGASLLESCRQRLFLCRREVAEAAAGNRQLNRPASPHPARARFCELYPKHGFAAAAKSTLRKERLLAPVKTLLKKNPAVYRKLRRIVG